MEYSTQTLTTAADCNVLLSMATKEKADLDFKRLSAERQTERFAETSEQLSADLLGVIAELAATDTIIAALPEGPSKEDAKDKKTRLEYRKFTIETRMENFGTTALLEKEMDLARVLKEIDEVEAFMQAVEVRLAQLPQAV